MSMRIKSVVDKFVEELKEALEADIQDRMMKEREMQSYIEEREREVAEREAAWKAQLSRREMSDGDERRNKFHASARRRLITFRVGSSSSGSKEKAAPSEPDFYEGGEFDQFQRELEEEMRNYQGSENEEAEYEEVGNEEAVNVEATSGLRVRRGNMGRFEVYAEGSSTSIPEPRRKVRARGKDTSWILTAPVPGGPLMPDVIPSFGGHIASILWSQPQMERLLTKYTRERSLAELGKWPLSERVRKIVDDSGLSHLPGIMHKNLNMPLLCAFVERWQPDTNTFHMPWGEMTILLHDVEEILRLEIDGFPCSISEADMAHPILGVSELLGMTKAQLGVQWGPEEDAKIYKGNLILNKALKELVEGDKRGFTTEAQSYLMILLSSTLFVDKSSDRVRANTFPMLRDVGSIGRYAWGAGTLAYLYRQLGIATRADCKGLCGCLTLLQSWIFEYFPAFRPMATLAASPGAPRAMLWSTTSIPQREAGRALISYREQLDMMPIESIAWRPYPEPPETEHPRSVYQGLLRFIDIVEPYQPDRCLRQFGFMQIIPTPMPKPDKAYRPAKSIAYDVQYNGAYLDHTWINWRMHKANLSEFLPAHPPQAYSVGYMEWFTSHSHPYLMNVPREADHMPTSRSHFPTTVGQSVIQRFSQFDNLEDPALNAEFSQWIRNVHPHMREYTRRPPIPAGTRGRRRGGRSRANVDEGESGRGRGESGNVDNRWSRSEPTSSRRTY